MLWKNSENFLSRILVILKKKMRMFILQMTVKKLKEK